MDSTVSDLRLRRGAQRALDQSRRWNWRFWSASETRAQEAREAVDRLERSAREQGLDGSARLLKLGAEVAETRDSNRGRLAAYRQVLDVVARGAAAGQSMQARIALEMLGDREDLARDFLQDMGNPGRAIPMKSAVAGLGLLAVEVCTPSELASAYIETGAEPREALEQVRRLAADHPAEGLLELAAGMPDLPAEVAVDALQQVAEGEFEDDPARWATRLLRTRPWTREEALALASYAGSRVEDGWTPVAERLRELPVDRLVLEREILGLQAARSQPDLECFVALAARLCQAPPQTPETARALVALAMERASEGNRRDRLAFVQAALEMPMVRPEETPALAAAGLTAASDPALAMVRAAGTCQDRLHLAQGGLGVLMEELDPERAQTVACFLPFLKRGDLQLRAELAEELLEAARGLKPGPAQALELGLTLLRGSAGLAPPEAYLDLGRVVLDRVEQLALEGGDQSLLPARVARLRQRLARGSEEEWDKVDLLGRELEELRSLTRDFVFVAATETVEGTLEVEEGFINIMDHQIAVRDEDAVTAPPLPEPAPPPAPTPGVRREPASFFPTGDPSEGVDPLPAGPGGGERRLEQAAALGSIFDNDYSRESQAVFTIAAAAAGFSHRAEQAAALGALFDDNYSTRSRAVFTQAAAVAGSAERAEEAHRLGTEFDDNYSTKTRCLFTLAAALAGDEESARRAHERAVALDGNYSTKTRALLNVATAIAGDNSDRATTLAAEFDGNYSHKSRSVFAVAVAAAGDEEWARRAYELAEQFDNNYSTYTRAMFTVAAAIAGDERRALRAFELAEELDGGYSQRSKALFAMAAAGCLNPARAGYAVPVQWDFLWPPDK